MIRVPSFTGGTLETSHKQYDSNTQSLINDSKNTYSNVYDQIAYTRDIETLMRLRNEEEEEYDEEDDDYYKDEQDDCWIELSNGKIIVDPNNPHMFEDILPSRNVITDPEITCKYFQTIHL